MLAKSTTAFFALLASLLTSLTAARPSNKLNSEIAKRDYVGLNANHDALITINLYAQHDCKEELHVGTIYAFYGIPLNTSMRSTDITAPAAFQSVSTNGFFRLVAGEQLDFSTTAGHADAQAVGGRYCAKWVATVTDKVDVTGCINLPSIAYCARMLLNEGEGGYKERNDNNTSARFPGIGPTVNLKV